MPDYELTSTWEEIDEAGQKRVLYVVMDSSTTALSTAADVYTALASVPTRVVMLIDTDGAQCIKAASSAYLDTVTFVLPTEYGYKQYVLDDTGHVAVTSHNYASSFVVDIYDSGSALACDKTLSDIAAALSANGVVGCTTPVGSGVLSYADTEVAKFSVMDYSGEDAAMKVYSVDKYGNVSVSEESFGSSSGVYGFVSIDAYRNFRTSYPDAIAVGDQVWIRGGTIAGASHTLYKFVSTDIPDHLQKIYAIDDPFLVTVTNTNGYVADKTYAQIVAAYNNGQRPMLMTEFGQIIPVVSADSNGVRFSGAIDSGFGFWIVTYTFSLSGIDARGVMTDFVPIFLSVSNGVYDVASWPGIANGIVPCISAIQSGADVCVVVPGANTAIFHRANYYVAGSEIRFSGLEVETVSGVEYTRAVTYIISVTSAHVRRVVGQAIIPPTNNDAGKVWTATADGNGAWVTPSGGADPEDIVAAVEDWLEENIDNPSNPPLDKSLLVEGAAADAKAVGKAIDASFYQSAKMKLIEILRVAAYSISGAPQMIDELEAELFPEGDVVSIDAVYTQDGAVVYANTPLDALRADLVVTATLSDSTTKVITDYTLIGTLTAGTSTVTVKYRDLTDDFTVTVTAAPTEMSITALYTQGSTVVTPYTPLNSLKADLVVMVNYSNTTSRQLDPTEYTLSGTLTEGTSTVDVAYNGFTDEFTVTVGPAPSVPTGFDTDGLICCLDGKQINDNLWYNLVTGVPFELHNVTVEQDGVTFAGTADSYGESTEVFGSGLTIEVVYKAASDSGNYAFFGTHQVSGGALCLMHSKSSGKIFSAYNSSSRTLHVTPVVQTGILSVTRGDSNSPAQIAVLNGTTVSNTASDYTAYPSAGIEGSKIATHGYSSMMFKGEILMVCIFNKRKTAAEMQANQAVYDAYYNMGILSQS